MKKLDEIICAIGFGNLIGFLVNLGILGFILGTKSKGNPTWVIVIFIVFSIIIMLFWLFMVRAIGFDTRGGPIIEFLDMFVIFYVIIMILSLLLYALFYFLFNSNANAVNFSYPLVLPFGVFSLVQIVVQITCPFLFPSQVKIFANMEYNREKKNEINKMSKTFGLDPSQIEVLMELDSSITEDINRKITKETELNESELVMLLHLIDFKEKTSENANNYKEVMNELIETYSSLYSSFSKRIKEVKTEDELINEEILSELKTIRDRAKEEGI